MKTAAMQNPMTRSNRRSTGGRRPAFSLVETLVVVTIASMLIVATLQIYHRVRGDAAVVSEKLTEKQLAMEILQQIAEDSDRLAAPGFDAQVMVQNKTDHGLFSARLFIMNKYYQNATPPKQDVYEQVVWQTDYDPETDSLILYRAHSGLNLEDKILDESRLEEDDPTAFIPVTDGVTFFEVQAITNQKMTPAWMQPALPQGIRIGISFALPEELPDGGVGIPEEKIVFRTIAIDRTRPLAYQFEQRVFDVNDFLPDETEDPNEPGEEDPMEPGDPSEDGGEELPFDPASLLPDEKTEI